MESKLALCIMVSGNKDLENLKRAVSSVRKFVSGVFITTNGRVYDKVEDYCQENGFHHSHKKWEKSFGAMREFNFSQVPEDEYDYIFWMDDDDVVLNPQLLPEIADNAKKLKLDTVLMSYWYLCKFENPDNPSPYEVLDVEFPQTKERLIRPGCCKWVNRLHEVPKPKNPEGYKYSHVLFDEKEMPIAVVHLATDMDDKKFSRNKELLELQLKDETEAGERDPRTILNLMKIYAEDDIVDNWSKVIEMNKEYQRLSGWDQERSVAWENAGIAFGRMKKHRHALEAFHNAIREWPQSVLPYLRLASTYYNLGEYDDAEHWMNVASRMDIEAKKSIGTNVYAIKTLFAELNFKLNYHAKRDINAASDAIRLLQQVNPSPETMARAVEVEELKRVNDACKNAHEILLYLEKTEQSELVIDLLNALPKEISSQQFAVHFMKKYQKPRVWEENEICYFANFGGPHFEGWSDKSDGIGGSETAVINLAREWAKMGYTVTVYGDPRDKQGFTRYGEGYVNYLPWNHFNPKDKFNIFVQWRSSSLADRVDAKKFYVDLHDVWTDQGMLKSEEDAVTKFMVKSQFHRNLGEHTPDSKFAVISNGISL